MATMKKEKIICWFEGRLRLTQRDWKRILEVRKDPKRKWLVIRGKRVRIYRGTT